MQVFKKLTICNKLLRTHLCRPQILEHRPHCRSGEPLKAAASKSCQLVDRRANDRAIYQISLLSPKEPCTSKATGRKCIHCLLIRDTSKFYALQPRWRWFPGYMKSLDSGDWVQELSQPCYLTPAGG